jgi:hypothetical protein
MKGVKVRRFRSENLLVETGGIGQPALLMEGKGAVESIKRRRFGKLALIIAVHQPAASR